MYLKSLLAGICLLASAAVSAELVEDYEKGFSEWNYSEWSDRQKPADNRFSIWSVNEIKDQFALTCLPGGCGVQLWVNMNCGGNSQLRVWVTDSGGRQSNRLFNCKAVYSKSVARGEAQLVLILTAGESQRWQKMLKRSTWVKFSISLVGGKWYNSDFSGDGFTAAYNHAGARDFLNASATPGQAL